MNINYSDLIIQKNKNTTNQVKKLKYIPIYENRHRIRNIKK
jgi:hypothetical protein